MASSADHDFRMEKDWWPEMYMGWPVDSTYHQVSNITMAANLKGKLLIVHVVVWMKTRKPIGHLQIGRSIGQS
ncbi:MAG: hypothetical protein R2822_15085 [Spirosomataceae bacterium]